MGGFFRVELGALSEMIDKLDQSSERMRGAMRALADVGPGRLGTDELDDACHDFQDRWQHGLKELGEFTGKATEGLRGTRQTYASVDQQGAQAFDKASGWVSDNITIGERGADGPGGSGGSGAGR